MRQFGREVRPCDPCVPAPPVFLNWTIPANRLLFSAIFTDHCLAKMAFVRSSAPGVHVDDDASWLIRRRRYSRQFLGLPKWQKPPDLSIDPESGLLSFINPDKTAKAFFVSVRGHTCRGAGGTLASTTSPTDANRTVKVTTFVVVVEPKQLVDVCKLRGLRSPADADIASDIVELSWPAVAAPSPPLRNGPAAPSPPPPLQSDFDAIDSEQSQIRQPQIRQPQIRQSSPPLPCPSACEPTEEPLSLSELAVRGGWGELTGKSRPPLSPQIRKSRPPLSPFLALSACEPCEPLVLGFPFAPGKAHLCSQGANGRLTHFAHASTAHAIDLDAEIGTPVLAVASGRVHALRESAPRGGIDVMCSLPRMAAGR